MIETNVEGHSETETTIKLTLLTKQDYAVILSAATENGFIEIGIAQGHPYVKYKISNSSIEKLSSTVRINNLVPHQLRIALIIEYNYVSKNT